MCRCPRIPAHPAPRGPLGILVFAQLLALGLWFSGTAVVPELEAEWGLSAAEVGALTGLVAVGFVAGTLVFAVLNIPDRFPPQLVFAASALGGAGAMALFVLKPGGVPGALALRFATGFALAGVYPVGMKILASWYERLGLALGVLVAALTLGSGSPYLVRASGLPWEVVVLTASALAAISGILVAVLVRPGPLLPSTPPRFDPRAFARSFRVPAFRRSALGYFGHMWELYGVWGLVPLFLLARGDLDATFVALATFGVFLAGAVGCVAGGMLSRRVGEARVALAALVVSAACCALSPLAFVLPPGALVAFLAVWGAAVIADSGMFSALSANAAPREFVGTSLTMQNAIGFAITFGSLTLVPLVADAAGWRWAMLLLLPGPVLGALAIRPLA